MTNVDPAVVSSRWPVDRIVPTVVLLAALIAGSGVAIGAFGAHGLQSWLESRLPDAANVELRERRLAQFETGVRYQLFHGLALLGLAAIAPGFSPRAVRSVSRWWLAGCLIFSGSLYLLVLSNQPRWGAVTPIGGVCSIVGWALLAWHGWRARAS
jgi:uncharacterized membrane protein YgdD (TMEM256/DUF423 family)